MSTKASKLKKVASAKINHHIGGLRSIIPAQMAVAGPPLATQLGQLGINIQQFVKDFNLRTSIYKEGVPLPTRTTINPDSSYNLVDSIDPEWYQDFLEERKEIVRKQKEELQALKEAKLLRTG